MTSSYLDLTADPNWRPLRMSVPVGERWQLSTWIEPVLPGATPYDSAVIAHPIIDGVRLLRLAVIDPVHNPLTGNEHNQALRSAQTIAQNLTRTADAVAALTGAAVELCDPLLRPRMRNPLAAVAVADLDLTAEDGTLRGAVTIAADCEVWIRRATGSWEQIAAGDMLTEQGRTAWDRALADAGPIDSHAHFAIKELLIDEPDRWACPAIGLTRVPRLRTATFTDAVEIIVSTDGPRLTASRCARLGDWLGRELQQGQVDEHSPSPHGDIALLHLYRNG